MQRPAVSEATPINMAASHTSPASMSQKQKIDKMVEATGEPPGTCEFYLESMSWNMDEAISMYYSYNAK